MIAQVTSAIFTARRETERLSWEKHRQERDWRLRESERFLSLKQELYSRYIALTNKITMETVLLTQKEYTNEPG